MEPTTNKIPEGNFVYRVPKYEVENVLTAKSQIIDWDLRDFGIPDLWKRTKGNGVAVALLDSGYTPHPDLQGAIAAITTLTNDGTNAVYPHGNMVAGIVAARGDEVGIVGVAPECQVEVIKVLDNNGSATTQTVVAGIKLAMEKRCRIINMSFGTFHSDPALYSICREASEAGFILVAAAGNEGPSLDTVNYPAKYDEVISVGAIDSKRVIAKFSSRGDRVDIVAPGIDLITTDNRNGYVVVSGTSFACPWVCGLIALLLAEHPTIKDCKEVKKLLLAAANSTYVCEENVLGVLIDPSKLL